MDDLPLDASPEDVAEQRSQIVPESSEDGLGRPTMPTSRSLSFEADPADIAEQLAEVPLDDEDWS